MMAAYFALRIKQKYDSLGLQAAQAYYNQVFTIQTYQQFQAETDAILVAEGLGDVIPA
jgi:hypothetical protein